MIGTTIGHYQIIAKLGEGGMGEVYRARDTKLGREVALKVLPESLARDPERITRFQREAQVIAALSHPNIVTVYSIDEIDGRWLLTMELVEGRDGVVIARERLEPVDVRALALALSDALASAHERGVVHRDLKPANVMRARDGRVKILDFGLARLEAPSVAGDPDTDQTEFATAPGVVVGTHAYMSPEQLRGEEADARSDVFSLGLTLYEIATGRHPFEASTSAERAASMLRDPALPLRELRSDLPPKLTGMIDGCLEKDPAARPTARDIHIALSQAEDDDSESTLDSIAVLSFADLSPERDQDHLCDGLSEELMSALTRIEGLKVASRTSCLQFKNVAADIRDIGRQLGVTAVVEGSVRKAGNRLRIGAQLTKVSDGYQLWAERYDRELEDVFEIQEDIASRIVKALQLTLSPRERRALQNVQTSNPFAYEYYLRGRRFHHQLSRDGLSRARKMFEKAIELDPNYARAYAGIADCSAYTFMLHEPDESLKAVVAEASRKAMELDPQLPEAHVARGQALLVQGDYAAAGAAFEAAIQLDPQSFEAHYFYGRSSFGQGDLDNALRVFSRATELKPDDYQAPNLAALVHRARGDREQEMACLRESMIRTESHLALYPDDVRANYFHGSALIVMGRKEEGIEWIRRALEMSPEDPHVGYNVACAFANAGEVEQALDCLENVAEGLKASNYYLDWLRSDPDLMPLRGMPRFEKFVETLRERYDANEPPA